MLRPAPRSHARRPRRLGRLCPIALAAASALGLLGAPLQAAGPAPTTLPQGLNVSHGQALVSTTLKGSAAQMTVRNSPGAILDWQSFSIGAQAGVHFQQVDAASKVLNRVSGRDPSAILGSLSSNGQVWLLNPNGVLFGAGARVDVQGLVASTLRLSDNAFLDGLRSGRFSFAEGAAGASVRNEGALRSAHGGHLVLLADRVENTGTLDAPGGALMLAGTRSATLVDSALPHLAAVVPAGEVLNLGRAAADGGVVDVYAGVVNQQGLVRADTLSVDAQGRIVLRAADTLMLGDGSQTQAVGTAEGQRGGAIDLLGGHIGLVGQARVDVSGAAGGGGIRLGGGLMGQDRSLPNAQAVFVGPDALLRADASAASGDGGSIIVWSDLATRAYGRFSARGGAERGDGGFIETSGGWLDARPASIDLAAQGGRAGTWLIDPNNLTISNTGPNTNITGGPSFGTTGDGAVITTATIAAALNAGTSVTLTTAAVGGTEAGDILMLGATLAVAPPSDVTLSLRATRDIVVHNSSITSTGSPLNLDLQAAGRGTGVVDIYNSLITTAGGNVTLGGQNVLTLPLPAGDTLPGTWRPAVSYNPSAGPPSLSRTGAQAAVNIEASTLELGTGRLRAVGFGTRPNEDVVLIGSFDDAATSVRGARIELVGVSVVPRSTDIDVGVAVVGNATDVIASQTISIDGGGAVGVVVEQGARLTLNGSLAGAAMTIRGWGEASEGGVVLLAGEFDAGGPVGRGSRLTVNNGSLQITGRSTTSQWGLSLLNPDGSPGPLLSLANATSATLESVVGSGYDSRDLRLSAIDIVPPTAAPLDISAAGQLDLDEVFVTGASGTLNLSGTGVSIANSSINSSAGPLNLFVATVGANPQGVSLVNTIVETRGGDVTFGDLRIVSSPILGSTTVLANWIETGSSDSSAALSLTDTVIDAGSGAIVGGGAVRADGFDVEGLTLSRSVLSGSRIELAGRTDFSIGLLLQESTLTATRVLRLSGDSASNAFFSAYGVQIGERSTLQLLDPTAATTSNFTILGRSLTFGTGVDIRGGAVGSGLETRISIEGADGLILGTSGSGRGLELNGSGVGPDLAGGGTAPGGVFISAPAARSLRLEGAVTFEEATGGTGTGAVLTHTRVVGPQLTTSSPLDIVGNGGNTSDGAGLRLLRSNLSSGGTTTLAGNSILVQESVLTGDGSINLFTVDRGASAGSVEVRSSSLQVSGATSRIFAGTRAGAAAIGDPAIAAGAGVSIVDSRLEASDSDGLIELRGQGADLGGRGVEFLRSPLSATTITLSGSGGFSGEGVFSDDLGSSLSTLTTTNLNVTGLSANDPAATSLTRAGVVLGRGVVMDLRAGGNVLIDGDLIVLGRAAGVSGTAAQEFSATGAPASFAVNASRSMLLRRATLDFSSGGGSSITLRGDTDGVDGGRVRLDQNTALLSGGGNISIEGEGARSALPALGLPAATVVAEGGNGVFVTGATINAGAGQITLTGRTPDVTGAGEPTLGGITIGIGTGVNSLTANRIVLDGRALSPGFGVVVGDTGSTVTSSLNANEIVVTGQGLGTIAATGRQAAGLRVLDLGSLAATSSLSIDTLGGSGVELVNGSLGSLGTLTINSSGPVRVSGTSSLTATGALAITGVGTSPVSPAVAEPGVTLEGGATTRGGTVTIDATQAGTGPAILLRSDTLLGLLEATTGDLQLSAGTDPTGGPVEIFGGWTLRTPSTLRITSPRRLVLQNSLSGDLSPAFDAATLAVTLAASTPLVLGGGVGEALDLSVFNDAVSGMASTSTVSIRTVGGSSVSVDGTLIVPGRLRLLSDGVTLASDSQMRALGAGDAIVIGGSTTPFTDSFVNEGGTSSLLTPSGRWVILTSGPGATTLGGLDPGFSAYGLSGAPWGVDASGDFITPLPGDALGYGRSAADVSGTVLTVRQTRAYDATTAITLDPGTWTVTGLIGGDDLLLSGSTAATMLDKAVGVDKPVTAGPSTVFSVVDPAGRPVFGYGDPALRATITPITLLAVGTTAANKVYDATTSATLASLGSVTPLPGDVVSLGGTLSVTFADKNVGTAKPVTLSGLALVGADAGNYVLIPPPPLAADITRRDLPITGVVAASKVYDGNTVATLSGTPGVSPLGADVVSLSGTGLASFADRNVGTAKPVSVGGFTLTGTDAGNYRLVPPPGLAADITPATLALSGLTALGKVYDATTAAGLSGTATLAPAFGVDVVLLSGTASAAFVDKNVGTAKPVLLSGLSLTGADAGNYVIGLPGLSADVTPATVLASGLVATSRVYDATTIAPLSGSATVTPLGGDSLTLVGTASGSFADRRVGTAKPVTLTGLTLGGADAPNYVLALPTTLAADITPRPLPVGGLAALNKVYDATTAATLTGTASIAPLGGDSVTLTGTAVATFADKNVGLAKPVTVGGFSLAGPDAINYTLVAPAGLAADISALPLAVTGLSALSRVYDRSTAVALSGTPTVAPLAGDSVLLSGTALGSFASAGVGTAKPVSLSGLLLTGPDAANYSLVAPTGLVADVTPRGLSLSGLAAASRVYDGSTAATVSGSLVGVLAGDAVSLSLLGSFADRNVGTAKPVSVAATLGGADAANYSLGTVASTSASITPATLRFAAVPAFGTAGQPLPTLTGTLSGLLGGDTLASATTGTLAWTSPATPGSPAGVYAINGGGLAALNYVFVQDAANATALTLRTATVSDPVSTATTVVTSSALLSVSLPVLMSSPTEGRTLDVTPAFSGSVGAEAERRARIASAGAPGSAAPGAAVGGVSLPSLGATLGSLAGDAAAGLSFGALDFSRLPRDEIQTLLAARARYKQQIFADGIHRLQQDPSLADVRACRNEAEIDTGVCLITEDLKKQIQAVRAEAQRVAQAATQAAEQAAQAARPGAAVAEPPRPGRVQRRVVQAALPVIERKLALLIGVNDYKDKAIPRLEGAVRDARAVRERLEQRLGYETTVLESPSREDIVRAFNRLALEAQPTDSVIIYFAGHGVLVPVLGVDTGFWLPADVDSRNEKTWLSNADIARLLGAIGSRQLMLISDSCFSGTLVGKERVNVGGDNPDELLRRRAAVVMSSGGEEPVADEGKNGHSFFAWHFMRAIEGLDRWQVGNSLHERLRSAVSREFPQTPQYGGSRGLGHEAGTDYLFERREIESTAKAP